MLTGNSPLSFYYVRLVQAYNHIKSGYSKGIALEQEVRKQPFLLEMVYPGPSVTLLQNIALFVTALRGCHSSGVVGEAIRE